jgi:hypothetical protein
MSSIATGVAAGVAQTAHQAQQTARQRDARARQTGHQAQRLLDRVDEHISVLDEADSEAPDQLRVTADAPHHQDQPDPGAGKPASAEPDDSAADTAGYDAAGKPAGPTGLYRHVDYNA